jgi:transcriptional regulator with XRE-family HTH domain
MAIDGAALRILRERSGFSAKAFADQVGISPQYLCDIEVGRSGRTLKRNPGLVKRMAEALDVPVTMIAHRAPGEDAA